MLSHFNVRVGFVSHVERVLIKKEYGWKKNVEHDDDDDDDGWERKEEKSSTRTEQTLLSSILRLVVNNVYFVYFYICSLSLREGKDK